MVRARPIPGRKKHTLLTWKIEDAVADSDEEEHDDGSDGGSSPSLSE